MDQGVENRKDLWSTPIPPALGKKSPVNFGPLTTQCHPNQLFERPYFGPYAVLPTQFFTRAGQWPKLHSAYPAWDGGPTTIFNNEHSKIGFKFSLLSVISLGPVGVTSRNYGTWCAARRAWEFGYNFWGPTPLNFGRAENVYNCWSSTIVLIVAEFDHDQKNENMHHYNIMRAGMKCDRLDFVFVEPSRFAVYGVR